MATSEFYLIIHILSPEFSNLLSIKRDIYAKYENIKYYHFVYISSNRLKFFSR
ncbi:conserved hypothetical protein [Xenorhabdus nematophila F1]|uniref:Uncharacterized protein n=1 Tax=Xenorhabdus nematophila (strain ATCC 19061 / DSM 3370 / CCUG 14189 / LMG 1036 / NCIMB 9965 / AN6) TaxID=406817 RepID=D3VFP9_XENNA|nr:hypothetical protein XNC1_2304 [Xenorhabdus nematophila ATCC 19061]CCW32368.1 conserved hypothetical protein [Xenorhabdus nematophila F1]CEE89940.1 hypothetical protein XNA1_1050005 [Xenorhabdus nematophila str. Anatoliense]CEF29478.1 hypothetical protein XNW1_1800005 [Xenorhabdus nematophila str. Websteri]CEK23216.1 hypothetical protein XNC2_2222 [Xenorhabdus nematophila AN6/1]